MTQYAKKIPLQLNKIQWLASYLMNCLKYTASLAHEKDPN